MPKKKDLTDDKIVEIDKKLRIKKSKEPTSMPASPTLKIKRGLVPLVEGRDYTRSNGEIEWLTPISPVAEVSVFDGATEVWRWSAARGEIEV